MTAIAPTPWISTTPATHTHSCTRCGETKTIEGSGRIPGWTLWYGHDHYGSGLEQNGNAFRKGYTCWPCTKAVEQFLSGSEADCG